MIMGKFTLGVAEKPLNKKLATYVAAAVLAVGAFSVAPAYAGHHEGHKCAKMAEKCCKSKKSCKKDCQKPCCKEKKKSDCQSKSGCKSKMGCKSGAGQHHNDNSRYNN